MKKRMLFMFLVTVLLFGVLAGTAGAVNQLELNTPQTLTIDASGSAEFSFTAPETGIYMVGFHSDMDINSNSDWDIALGALNVDCVSTYNGKQGGCDCRAYQKLSKGQNYTYRVLDSKLDSVLAYVYSVEYWEVTAFDATIQIGNPWVCSYPTYVSTDWMGIDYVDITPWNESTISQTVEVVSGGDCITLEKVYDGEYFFGTYSIAGLKPGVAEIKVTTTFLGETQILSVFYTVSPYVMEIQGVTEGQRIPVGTQFQVTAEVYEIAADGSKKNVTDEFYIMYDCDWDGNQQVLSIDEETGVCTANSVGEGWIWAGAESDDGDYLDSYVNIYVIDVNINGWQKIDGLWYYYEDGVPVTGWKKIDGTYYYLAVPSGWMYTGWLEDGGKWYYLKSSGAMATGWQKIDGTYYYFASSGAMKTGWLKDGGKWYYLKSSGAMATGWQKISGTYYYFASTGAMKTGWLKDGGKWYYLKSSGAMTTGWQKISGSWYYFTSSGAMKTGWLQLGSKWYYLKSSGEMVTGDYTIGGKIYHFDDNGVWIS